MTTRIGQIFWGLILVALDFTINGFDVLPDFVGYALVAIGSAGLTGVSRRFSAACVMAWILAGVSIALLLLRGDPVYAVAWAASALDVAAMWFLLGGLMDIAKMYREPGLAGQLSGCRIAYLILVGLSVAVGLAGAMDRELAGVTAVVLAVSMIVLLIVILASIRRVKTCVVRGLVADSGESVF